MDSAAANNKVTSIILIVTFGVFVVALLLSEWDALAEVSYSLHELMFIIRVLSLLMLPLEGIIWFIFWRTYRRNKIQATVQRTILNDVSLFLFVMVIITLIISLTTKKIEGSSLVIDKWTYDDQFFIELDSHWIQTSKEQYDEIEENAEGNVQGYFYLYEYIQNDLVLGRNSINFLEIEKIKMQN